MHDYDYKLFLLLGAPALWQAAMQPYPTASQGGMRPPSVGPDAPVRAQAAMQPNRPASQRGMMSTSIEQYAPVRAQAGVQPNHRSWREG